MVSDEISIVPALITTDVVLQRLTIINHIVDT